MWYRALADTHQRGALDITEFTIAMHLIQSLMSNHISAVPASLPPDLLAAASVSSPTVSQVPATVRRTNSVSSSSSGRAPQLPPKVAQSPIRTQFSGTPDALGGWDITPQDKANFDALFRGIDTGNKGYIDGKSFLRLCVDAFFRHRGCNLLFDVKVTGRSLGSYLGFI